MNLISKTLFIVILLATCIGGRAAEVVYRLVDYNKSTGEFTLAASGQVPKGAWAYFDSKYGATTGNRYNQIPRNNQATLYLEGWQGCSIKSVTLSLCSNNQSGQLGLSVNDGKTPLYVQRPADFASDTWFGQWVSKNLGVYVDITKTLNLSAFSTPKASITLQGGNSEGSVYVDAISIEYDEVPGTELESPLGWRYEKLGKKSTLQVGDEVMLYRNGCAAADIDGMETAHYLDAVPLASTYDVSDHDVLCFTLGQENSSGTWTLTDQHGRTLGATNRQTLAWNDGKTQWHISLGYDGATITNADTRCGTLLNNAPVDGYARFNVYTSNSLPLPFIYRKSEQLKAVISTSLTFESTELEATLESKQLALRPTLLPSSTTDKRIVWESSNPQVATVNGGFVSLLAEGDVTLTARAKDGGSQASMLLHVTSTTQVRNAPIKHGISSSTSVRKVLRGKGISIVTPTHIYDVNGVLQQ